MSSKTIRKLVVFGFGFSLSGIIVGIGMILAFTPELTYAQDPVALVKGAAIVAEHLPTDVIRLALTGIIVLSCTLVVVAGLMQKMIAAKDSELRKQTDKFADVMEAMSKRLCVMDQPASEALMRDKFELAYHDAHLRDKKRHEEEE